MAASPLGPSRKGSPCLNNIQPGQEEFLADIEGPGVIQHIWITVDSKTSEGDCFVLRDLIMRMYWDGEENPSVEVPLGDFFCCGFGQECIVNSAIITVVPSRGLNSYFAMPFHKHARITIENQHKNPIPAFFIRLITACMIRFQKTLLIFMLSGEGRQSLKLEKIMLFLIM